MSNLDWDKIWEEFNKWYDKKTDEGKCPVCGVKKSSEPEWPDQKKAIQRIVNKHLKNK